MGSSSSKVARRLPTKPKPSWAGTTANEPSGSQQSAARPALASETRTKDIEMDAGDPQFLRKLNQLGPVKVDHHMATVRTDEHMKSIFQTRQASEQQAAARVPPRNRILASELVELLEKRKSAGSSEIIREAASQYNMDIEVLARLSKVVNTPSIIPGSQRRVVGENGEERDTMLAGWIERDNPSKPAISPELPRE